MEPVRHDPSCIIEPRTQNHVQQKSFILWNPLALEPDAPNSFMKRKILRTLLAASILYSAGNSLAQALPPAAGPRHVPGELIIQFTLEVTDAHIAAAFQQGGLNLIEHVRTPAMEDHAKIGLTRVATAMPLAVALEVLNGLPGVQFAELHGIAQPDFVADDPFYLDGSLWGVYSDDLPSPIGPSPTSNPFGSQAEKLWAAGYIGSPDVYVGIIDTGFQPDHPDLAGNVWTNLDEIAGDGLDNDGNGYVDDIHGWNSVENNGNVFDANSGSHGTAVAGIVGAVGGNGLGVAGINWNVKLISGRCFSTSGVAIIDAVEAIDYMTTLKTKNALNIAALNNSYSGSGISLALQDALTRAASAGILAICSAGNQKANTDTSPRWPTSLDTTADAGYDAVVSVAAIDANGSKADFSNWGAFSVDAGAPGVGILSTVPNGVYSSGQGTSYASPHIAGAAALYASIYPSETAAQIKYRLLTAGILGTPSLDAITLTGGRLDAYALANAPAITIATPAAPSSLTATSRRKGVVDLAWADRSTDEKAFAIERKLSTSTTWQTVATVAQDTTKFSNTSLASRKTYNYRVRAYNAAGSSTYSDEATVKLK